MRTTRQSTPLLGLPQSVTVPVLNEIPQCQHVALVLQLVSDTTVLQDHTDLDVWRLGSAERNSGNIVDGFRPCLVSLSTNTNSAGPLITLVRHRENRHPPGLPLESVCAVTCLITSRHWI